MMMSGIINRIDASKIKEAHWTSLGEFDPPEAALQMIDVCSHLGDESLEIELLLFGLALESLLGCAHPLHHGLSEKGRGRSGSIDRFDIHHTNHKNHKQ